MRSAARLMESRSLGGIIPSRQVGVARHDLRRPSTPVRSHATRCGGIGSDGRPSSPPALARVPWIAEPDLMDTYRQGAAPNP